MVNWEERVRKQAASAAGGTGREAPWSAERDPGTVAAHVMPALSLLAKRHGHTVRLCHDLPRGLVGLTESGYIGGVKLGGTVHIRAGMSPASTARALAHEIGHVLAYVREDVAGRVSAAEMRDILGVTEDSAEEAACELGAAAFCAAYDIGTGQVLKRYLGQRRGAGVTRAIESGDAAANAQALWQACQDYQYRHLAS